jgi:hypothetical protein
MAAIVDWPARSGRAANGPKSAIGRVDPERPIFGSKAVVCPLSEQTSVFELDREIRAHSLPADYTKAVSQVVGRIEVSSFAPPPKRERAHPLRQIA